MFRWFETRIEAFPEAPLERPPSTLFAYYVYFIRPVWPAFAALLIAGLLGALIEVALMTFIGNLVDLMRAAASPAHFMADHGPILLWMGLVAVVARPLVSTVHDLIKNQI
ncbi:MAG TPA: multidrug ABC transporter ATP-binding protein, partial [Hyphomicrobiaceae bacterium]|nr:multidrug ABC transporter ATP-binding protein [Hyphomicrobiaceae bacterium]